MRVDGTVVATPQARVRPEQRVEIEKNATPQHVPPVTLVLHKPAGVRINPAAPLAGMAPGVYAGRRTVRPMSPTACCPRNCSNGNGADMAAVSASRARRNASMFSGCRATSKPTSTSLPCSGATYW